MSDTTDLAKKIFIDSYEISSSIEARRRNPSASVLCILFRPKYVGKEKDPVSGKEYHSYKLEELDELGIPYVVMPLDFGDYHIPLPVDEDGMTTVIVIERKTVNDLIGSFIGTKGAGEIRIDEQLEKCLKRAKESFDKAIVVLMIEDFYKYMYCIEKDDFLGIWNRFKLNRGKKEDSQGKPKTAIGIFGKNGMMNPRALLAKIDAIEKMGVVVWKMGGAMHAHEIITKMLLENKDKKTKSIKSTRRKVSAEDPYKSYVFFLQGLPGVGGGRGTDIAEKFPIPIDFIESIKNAKDEKDLGIAGIGEGTFNLLKSFFTEKKEKKVEDSSKKEDTV